MVRVFSETSTSEPATWAGLPEHSCGTGLLLRCGLNCFASMLLFVGAFLVAILMNRLDNRPNQKQGEALIVSSPHSVSCADLQWQWHRGQDQAAGAGNDSADPGALYYLQWDGILRTSR